MATIAEPPRIRRQLEPDDRIVLRGVGWEGYETLLRLVGDGHVRLACDGKDVELMSPSCQHDEWGRLLGRFVSTLAEELEIPCRAAGSTTWRKVAKQRGLEADESFYLANTGRALGRKPIDLAVDPPPDLAVEVDITSSSLDRMGINAALGVPEVWRFDGESLRVAVLQPDGTYGTAESSPSFPFLDLAAVVRWILLAEGADHSRWGRQLRAWIREVLAPRLGGAGEDRP